MTKRILMIAYHFPPVRGSSGMQRTLKFSRYLRDHGWQPTILSIKTSAYVSTRNDLVAEVPPDMDVIRALGFDSARHFSIGRRYPEFLCIPDRWSTWFIFAVLRGFCALKKHDYDVIWSTYPIATAHLIGLALHKLTRIPWVADFRDSMTENDYPAPGSKRSAYQWIERKTIQAADRIVFTAPGSIEMYKKRYPKIDDDKWVLIRNGFDERNFVAAESRLFSPSLAGREKITLVHSGTLYPSERDPIAFFRALSELRSQNTISARSLRIVLRSTGHDEYLRPLIDSYQLSNIVSLEPSISYNSALQEMLLSDGLIILQAKNCNHQIPAKLYEYLRANRPILCLSDPAGDTAKTLRIAGVNSTFDISDSSDIAMGLSNFLVDLRSGRSGTPDSEFVRQCSREYQTKKLAALLNSIGK